MSQPMHDTVPKGFRECGVVLVLVADLVTGHLRCFGNALAARTLVSTYFGVPSAFRSLAASYRSSELPAALGQGSDLCVVARPSERIFVGLIVTGYDPSKARLLDLIEQLRVRIEATGWEHLAPPP